MTDYTTLSDRDLEIEWRKAQGWSVRKSKTRPNWYVYEPDGTFIRYTISSSEQDAIKKIPELWGNELLDAYDSLPPDLIRSILSDLSEQELLVRDNLKPSERFKRAVLIASLKEKEHPF